MVKICAEKITAFLISNKQIDNSEYEMYVYAYETLIAFFINIVAIITIGFICNKFIHTLLFLCFYCPIRQFSGGYHADNYRKCLLTFLLMYLLNISILDKLIYLNRTNLIIILICSSYIGIWILAPIEHRNNPLTCDEKNHYKNIVRCLVSIVLTIVIIGIKFKIIYEYVIYIGSVIVCVFIMLLLAIIKDKRRLK